MLAIKHAVYYVHYYFESSCHLSEMNADEHWKFKKSEMHWAALFFFKNMSFISISLGTKHRNYQSLIETMCMNVPLFYPSLFLPCSFSSCHLLLDYFLPSWSILLPFFQKDNKHCVPRQSRMCWAWPVRRFIAAQPIFAHMTDNNSCRLSFRPRRRRGLLLLWVWVLGTAARHQEHTPDSWKQLYGQSSLSFSVFPTASIRLMKQWGAKLYPLWMDPPNPSCCYREMAQAGLGCTLFCLPGLELRGSLMWDFAFATVFVHH